MLEACDGKTDDRDIDGPVIMLPSSPPILTSEKVRRKHDGYWSATLVARVEGPVDWPDEAGFWVYRLGVFDTEAKAEQAIRSAEEALDEFLRGHSDFGWHSNLGAFTWKIAG